jgi:hypothetical protein
MLSEAKHLWSIPLSGIGRKIDPRLKAWPRGFHPLRCSFASLRMTVEMTLETMKWVCCQLGAREHCAIPRLLAGEPKEVILFLVNTPAEIQHAIEKLPTDELLEVAAWLDDYRMMIKSSESLFQQLDAEEGDVAGQQMVG